MTHLRRRVKAPGTYFVTSNTWQRRPLFLKEPPAALFLECLFHYRNQGNFLLHEFVLMPDHFHLLLTPEQGIALERAMQLIKGGSSRRIGKELGYEFPIWQTGFSDHRIRSQDDFTRYKKYISSNPVKKELVQDPAAYPFCSCYAELSSLMDPWPRQTLTSAAKAAPNKPQATAGLKPGPDITPAQTIEAAGLKPGPDITPAGALPRQRVT